MKWTVLAILVAVAALGAALFLISDGGISLPRQVSDQHKLMGTVITITVHDENAKAAASAIEGAFARIAQVEAIASAADETSELSELNRASYLASASDELVEMLRLAFVVHQVSKGAFDVSHGALLDLWRVDFGTECQFTNLDTEVQSASITAARKHVGMDRILLGSGRKTSISLVPGTRIVLDGIAVGYAVDAAIESLRIAGIESVVVDAGSAVRVIGTAPNGSPLTVGRLLLDDCAIATVAGDSHILDPRTGYPATAASGATVIAPTCAEAQSLAWAVFILGPDAGLSLIEQLANTEALICGPSTEPFQSSGFAETKLPTSN